jgi:hypothetical protein
MTTPVRRTAVFRVQVVFSARGGEADPVRFSPSVSLTVGAKSVSLTVGALDAESAAFLACHLAMQSPPEGVYAARAISVEYVCEALIVAASFGDAARPHEGRQASTEASSSEGA